MEIKGKLHFQAAAASSNSRLKLSLQLVSATVAGKDGRGVKGEQAQFDGIIGTGESEHEVKLLWDEKHGTPGAVIVTNHSDFPVYLKTVSMPGFGSENALVYFVCNGWVYPVGKHPYRLFFTNDTYVKEKTPGPLVRYREHELNLLRGHGATEPFQEWDRVYDYAYYNDLGNPDLRKDLERPVLGGSKEHPYPRRAKTERPPTKTDRHTESRVPLDQQIYIPCDERLVQINPEPQPFPPISGHFESFAEIFGLFGLDELGLLTKAKEIINSDAGSKPMFPVPQVISANTTKWQTDKEFAREMLAGANPVVISRLLEFPPRSKLDRRRYGDQDSKIAKHDIEKNMDGMTVEQALDERKLYMVDHHDWAMPYLKLINQLPDAEEKNEISTRKVYATRTLLFLKEDSTLKPLAIELSSPNSENERHGAISTVYTPPITSDAGTHYQLWQLAKTHAVVSDTGKNQLVSHWLHTHASMEPFVIATNRHLSVLHPIHKLLKPHFRNTMNVNSLARQLVIGSGDLTKKGEIYRGTNEVTLFPGKYSMEMSSQAYNNWNFTEQALPADLIKRGIAEGDPRKPEELKLLIKDYPYAVDGLDIWIAIKKWVADYCKVFYDTDHDVKHDSELQEWWKEVQHVGHGDKRHEPWWPKMHGISELVESCTTIIWVASALHAAVSFGQYAYNGYVPNRPSISCLPMPESEANSDEAYFLATITPKSEALKFMSLNLTSTPVAGELYLGQRDTKEWTKEQKAIDALAEFGEKLKSIEDEIKKRNGDPTFKNRNGPVEVPYTLLTPTANPGPILYGIPNSITV